MNILITGGSGFVGSNLIKKLSGLNYQLLVLTRDINKTSQILKYAPDIEYFTTLDQIPSNTIIDYIVNLAGASISAYPWTSHRKQILMQSRISITESLLSLINRLKTKPKKLLSASATGWYGTECTNIKVDENYIAEDNSFSHILCDKWEKAAIKATEHKVEVDILRFGVVLGASGGMLGKLRMLFKLGLGLYFSDGSQHMSWIHIEDLISAIIFLIDKKANEGKSFVYNFSTPSPVTNKKFSLALAQSLNRQLLIKIPKFFIELFMGQMGKELFQADQACLPANLIKEGYQFKYENIDDALKNIYPSKLKY